MYLVRRSWAWMPFNCRPPASEVKDLSFFLFNNFYFSINVSKSCFHVWPIEESKKKNETTQQIRIWSLTQKAKQLSSLNIFDVNFVIFCFCILFCFYFCFIYSLWFFSHSIFGFRLSHLKFVADSFLVSSLYHFCHLPFDVFPFFVVFTFLLLFNYNYACI